MSCAEASMGLLLHDIKVYLNITWEDDATDARIRGLIEDGMAYLDDKLGEPGNYTSTGLPRTLLKDYVRYARDDALDVFENNYQSLILAMVNNKGVQSFGTRMAGTETP